MSSSGALWAHRAPHPAVLLGEQPGDDFTPFLGQHVVGTAGRAEIHELQGDAARFERAPQRTAGRRHDAIGADEQDLRMQREERLKRRQVQRLRGLHRPVRDQARAADDAGCADRLPANVDFATRVRAHGQYLRIGVEYQSHGRYDTTVPRLILVLRDLYPARLSEAARATLPRLPELERWLAQGETDLAAGDWRQWLQREARGPAARGVPPASIAGAAVSGVPAGVPVWFASPIHLVAGLDTVRVHPAGLLQLSSEDQCLLERDFMTVFAHSGWSLHATGRRELLLAGGPALQPDSVRSQDPALWLGADPREGLPAGPAAGTLRRLGAEMEMWLHEHPINEARRARGTPAANAVWIWGGGRPALSVSANAVSKPSGAAVAWADDLFVDGLARLEGFAVGPLPPRWPPSTNANRVPEADVLAVCGLGADASETALEGLERDWVAPALEHWRAVQWHSATLLVGARAVTLARGPWRSLWRRFRRPQPWWETLLQCSR